MPPKEAKQPRHSYSPKNQDSSVVRANHLWAIFRKHLISRFLGIFRELLGIFRDFKILRVSNFAIFPKSRKSRNLILAKLSENNVHTSKQNNLKAHT